MNLKRLPGPQPLLSCPGRAESQRGLSDTLQAPTEPREHTAPFIETLPVSLFSMCKKTQQPRNFSAIPSQTVVCACDMHS